MSGYMTRPFYCPHHDNHVEATHYVVWGGERQTLLYYEIECSIKRDITPHLIAFDNTDTEHVAIAISCGIVGCGVTLIDTGDIALGMQLSDITDVSLPRKEFLALMNFKYTGYELKKKYYGME